MSECDDTKSITLEHDWEAPAKLAQEVGCSKDDNSKGTEVKAPWIRGRLGLKRKRVMSESRACRQRKIVKVSVCTVA